MLGLRYAEWATRAPSLEADIAAAALGLDDLGHSRGLHGRSWLRSGIDTGPLHRAWREAIEWFGPPDGETAQLYKDGRLSMGPAELQARLEERLESRVPEMTIDWKQWDPIRRRGRSGAVDERTFAMLRGLEEKRFAQAKEA